MGDFSPASGLVIVAADNPDGKAEAAEIDEAHVKGENQPGEDEPAHNQGKISPHNGDGGENGPGKGVGERGHGLVDPLIQGFGQGGRRYKNATGHHSGG